MIRSGTLLFSFLTIITAGRMGFRSLEQLQRERLDSFAGVHAPPGRLCRNRKEAVNIVMLVKTGIQNMLNPDYAIGFNFGRVTGNEKRDDLSQSPRNHSRRFMASDNFRMRRLPSFTM